MYSTKTERSPRKFYSETLQFSTWDDVANYYQELEKKSIDSLEELLTFLAQRSELDKIVEEEYRWRYVRMTCDTENEFYKQQYEEFLTDALPKLMSASHQLNLKIYSSSYFTELPQDRFFIYTRNLQNQIELFREENIALIQQEQLTAQEYGSIIGQMTIILDGIELTLPQAAVKLQDKNRQKRKEVFESINARRLQDADKLNVLFSELIQLRHQIAVNAGFTNYRDYKLKELGRFDYGIEDCEQFHDAIQQKVIPLVNNIIQQRKLELEVVTLQPYDLDVDIKYENPLQPYSDEKDFISKSIACLKEVDDYFANCIATMHKMQFLDLSSRKGKAPGGYNMSMPEIGIPFIFMNGAGTQRDVETIVHEAGHAVHTFLMQPLAYNFDAEISSEIAELASMSMEFFTYDGWQQFYNKEDKQRAIQAHLKGVITMLPWIALIDKFQHWIYTHPQHSEEERMQTWKLYYQQFSSNVVDWSDYEHIKAIIWQKQLHLFEVPFYYIEYGIAQLGAIAMYKNYSENKTQTIAQYKEALSVGYTKTIPEIYTTAGVSFSFNSDYVEMLMAFIQQQLV